MKYAVATVLLVLCLSSPSHAAEFAGDKGSWRLGGAVSFAYRSGDLYEVDNDNVSEVNFSFAADCFVSRGFSAGFGFTIYHSNRGRDITEVGFGPRLAVYLSPPSSDDARPPGTLEYVEIFGAYSHTTATDEWVLSAGAGFGVEILLSEAVALDTGIRYMREWRHGTYVTFDPWGPYSSGSTRTGYRFQLGLGISYFIF
ncbi:hypothetical protein GF420_14885 [candidate division GN15 bacterium]|nr:hypothetical protein [candidate division GN15 bacterium]